MTNHTHPASWVSSSYQIRRGISYCEIDGDYVLLDLQRDKYLRLSENIKTPFRLFVGGLELSIADGNALERAGILEKVASGRPVAAPTTLEPRRQHEAALHGSFNLGHTLRAAQLILRAKRKLRRMPIADVFAEIQTLKNAQRRRAGDSDLTVRRIVRAFEDTRLWMGSADQCLPRSVAMTSVLLKQGLDVQLVLGVRTDPFRAHSWVQKEHTVLNDTSEEVGKFTPILVI